MKDIKICFSEIFEEEKKLQESISHLIMGKKYSP